MNRWARWIIGSDKNIDRRNMSWNMVGSFLYAFASMVLSIAVIQLVGEDLGGIFTFGYSTFGQHMFMVAYFGIRPFHITDTESRYSFGEYLRLRYLTCAAAVLFGLFYVFVNGYSYVKAMTVIWLVIYKVVDGFADAYEAEFQRNGRLYLTGKSNTFRTLLSVGVFLSVLYVTRNLVWASQAGAGAQLLGLLLFDVAVMRAIPGVDRSVKGSQVCRLFRDNLLLFFSVVLDFYIFSAAKYAIEGNMTDADLAVYGAIFIHQRHQPGGRVRDPALPHQAVGAVGEPPLQAFPEHCEESGSRDSWADGGGGSRRLVSGDSGAQPSLSQYRLCAGPVPDGASLYHPGRRAQRADDTFLLQFNYNEMAARDLRRVSGRGCGGVSHFAGLRAGHGNRRRRVFLYDTDVSFDAVLRRGGVWRIQAHGAS